MADITYDANKIPTLSKVKIGENTYWLKDAAAREVIDIINNDYLKAADKTELLNKIAEKVAISDYNTKMTALDAEDARIDTALSDEIARATGVEEDLQHQIDAIEEGLVKVKSGDKVLALDGTSKELSTEIKLVYDSESRKIQLTGIGDILISEFSADAFIKDGMLLGTNAFVADATSKTVTIKEQTHEFTGLVAGHQYLAFCFTDGAVPTPTYSWEIADLQDMVDVYTGGNGINVANNVITAVAKSGDKYIEVTENGIASKGIDDAISEAVAAEATIARAAEEANTAAVNAEVTRATNKEDELNTAITTEVARAEGQEAAIRSEFAAADTALHTTITGEITSAVTEEETRAKAAEEANAAAIAAEETRAKAAEEANAAAIEAAADDLTALTTRVSTAENDIDAIEAKESGWDAKLDNVKLNEVFLTVKSDVAGKGNYVDLGSIATTESVVANVSYEDASHTLKQQKGELTSSVHQFGDLADENLANLEVKGQTISGVTATGTSTGELTGALGYTSTQLDSTGSFTATGSIDVTLAGNTFNAITSVGRLAQYTPETVTGGKATVIDKTAFNGGKAASIADGFVTAGSDASLTGGSVASLTNQSTAKFANKVLKPAIASDDAECLIFEYVDSTTESSAFADAVTDRGTFTANTLQTLEGGKATIIDTSKFNGGSAASLGDNFVTAGTDVNYTASSYTAAELPAMESQTVSVATQTFTGTANQQVSVAGNYDKANLGTVAFNGKSIELDVGDIVVADKAVSKRA